jgi:uridine phosphorylase
MKSTELILNADGSVYHLALKPGEVSDTVITVGDPDRVAKVSQLFDSVDIIREKREFVTHTGMYKGLRLSVISTGIGTDNIDIVFNELHSLKQMAGTLQKPYSFIRLGTSGTVQNNIAINSILISEAALGFDGLLHFYEWNEGQTLIDELLQSDTRYGRLPRPYAAFAGEELLRQFKPMCDTIGVTVTAPGFYAPQGRSVNAPIKVPDFTQLLTQSYLGTTPITNIEMETAGIYGLASLFGHQAISISAILANRSTGEFSTQPERIVQNMIESALEIIVKG